MPHPKLRRAIIGTGNSVGASRIKASSRAYLWIDQIAMRGLPGPLIATGPGLGVAHRPPLQRVRAALATVARYGPWHRKKSVAWGPYERRRAGDAREP